MPSTKVVPPVTHPEPVERFRPEALAAVRSIEWFWQKHKRLEAEAQRQAQEAEKTKGPANA